MRAVLLATMLLVLPPAVVNTASATTEVGVMGILYNVHGYNSGGTALVPLRGVAEWLGALVDYDDPNIIIEYGPTLLRLKIGSRTAYINGVAHVLAAPARCWGGVTCVPLRFVADAFNIVVSYHPRNSAEGRAMGGIPVIVTHTASGINRIIVHGEPPHRVQRIIADLNWNAGDLMWDRWGKDWVLSVRNVRGLYADVYGPAFYSEGYGFSPTELSDRPILYADGRWWFPAGY